MEIIYHSDENCRRGCHVVSRRKRMGHKVDLCRLFSVDEPGAWWEDHWNCHVDGCDYPADSRDDAIGIGMKCLGYSDYTVSVSGAYYLAGRNFR